MRYKSSGNMLVWPVCLMLCCCFLNTSAQPGISEMNPATGQLRGSFFSARDATMVLAGLLGICGAVNIYYNFFMILMVPFQRGLYPQG